MANLDRISGMGARRVSCAIDHLEGAAALHDWPASSHDQPRGQRRKQADNERADHHRLLREWREGPWWRVRPMA